MTRPSNESPGHPAILVSMGPLVASRANCQWRTEVGEIHQKAFMMLYFRGEFAVATRLGLLCRMDFATSSVYAGQEWQFALGLLS